MDPGEPRLNNIFDPAAAFDGNPPQARLTVSPDSGITAETEFTLDASRSKESEMPDAVLYYSWDFNNDGIWDTPLEINPVTSYQFTEGGGNRSVRVLVRGAKNLYANTSASIFVNTRPDLLVQVIKDPVNPALIHFDASDSWDFEDGDNLEYRWDFDNDGSWDISWNDSPLADHEFSAAEWVSKAEARDQTMLSSQRILPMALPEDAIAYYPFNGNADDASGYQNHGTVYGATLTQDRFGRPASAYHFDGEDDFIDLGHSNNLKPALPVTVSAWIYIEQYGGIFRNNSSDRDYFGFMLNLSLNGKLGTGFGDGGRIGPESRRSFTSYESVTMYAWHHVAGIIKSATDMALFIDGSLADGTYHGEGGAMKYNQNPADIGLIDSRQTAPPYYFGGIIDEVRIYKRALTSTEIVALYSQ